MRIGGEAVGAPAVVLARELLVPARQGLDLVGGHGGLGGAEQAEQGGEAAHHRRVSAVNLET